MGRSGPNRWFRINIQFLPLIVIQIPPVDFGSSACLCKWGSRQKIFFIGSHKMPRIPEDCKYLEVALSQEEEEEEEEEEKNCFFC